MMPPAKVGSYLKFSNLHSYSLCKAIFKALGFTEITAGREQKYSPSA
jgi:hypothetical protein